MSKKNIDIEIPIPNDFFNFSIDENSKEIFLNTLENLKIKTDISKNKDLLLPSELSKYFRILYDNLKYISYKEFINILLDCFVDFTEYLLEKVKILNEYNKGKLPKDQKKIKIYIKKNYGPNTGCKSIHIYSLIFYIFKLVYVKFPSSKLVQIVDFDKNIKKYKGNLDFNIFLIIDDGIYSGNQINKAIIDIKGSTKHKLNISIISPFVSIFFYNKQIQTKTNIKFFYKIIMENSNKLFDYKNSKDKIFIKKFDIKKPLYYFEFKMPDVLSFLPELLNNKLFDVVLKYYNNENIELTNDSKILKEEIINKYRILKDCPIYKNNEFFKKSLEENGIIQEFWEKANTCPFPYYKPQFYNYKKYIKISEFIEKYIISYLNETINIDINKINQSKLNEFIDYNCLDKPKDYSYNYFLKIAENLSNTLNETNKDKLDDYLESQDLIEIKKQILNIINNIKQVNEHYDNKNLLKPELAASPKPELAASPKSELAAFLKTKDDSNYFKKYLKYKYKYIELKKIEKFS